MRRVRYSVAMSLDGYIAGPRGQIDRIAVVPVLRGDGVPLLLNPARQARLTLSGHRVYEPTGPCCSSTWRGAQERA